MYISLSVTCMHKYRYAEIRRYIQYSEAGEIHESRVGLASFAGQVSAPHRALCLFRSSRLQVQRLVLCFIYFRRMHCLRMCLHTINVIHQSGQGKLLWPIMKAQSPACFAFFSSSRNALPQMCNHAEANIKATWQAIGAGSLDVVDPKSSLLRLPVLGNVYFMFVFLTRFCECANVQ